MLRPSAVCRYFPCGLSQLTANTPEDYNLKFKLLNDVLDVIDMENRYVFPLLSASTGEARHAMVLLSLREAATYTPMQGRS